jgi:Leucine-rich repeat (LRR) protein
VAPIDPISRDRHRASSRLPRPLWIGIAATVLLIIATGVHVGLPIYRQENAVRQIRRLGGWERRSRVGPKWLRELAGEERVDRFAQVEELYLIDTEFGDADVARLRLLPAVKVLYLDGTKVTDAGLGELTTMSLLEELHLKQTAITDHGLASLERLAKLRELDVSHTDLTDAGLSHIATMTQLRRLWLDESGVTRRAAIKLNNALPHRPVQWTGLWSRNDPFSVLSPGDPREQMFGSRTKPLRCDLHPA